MVSKVCLFYGWLYIDITSRQLLDTVAVEMEGIQIEFVEDYLMVL